MLIPFKLIFPHLLRLNNKVKIGFFIKLIKVKHHIAVIIQALFIFSSQSSRSSQMFPHLDRRKTCSEFRWLDTQLSVYGSHSWQSTSEQRPSHEVEGAACRAQRHHWQHETRDWILRIKSGGNQASLFICLVPLWHTVMSGGGRDQGKQI